MTFEVEELFVLWGIVFAVLEVEAEQEPVQFSRIEVVQGDVSQSASSKNWLLVGNETVLAGPLTSPDPEQQPEAVGSVSRVYTYLAHFADPDAAGQISPQQPFQVFIHGEQGRISRSVVNPARFSPERLATTEIGKAVVETVGISVLRILQLCFFLLSASNPPRRWVPSSLIVPWRADPALWSMGGSEAWETEKCISSREI